MSPLWLRGDRVLRVVTEEYRTVSATHDYSRGIFIFCLIDAAYSAGSDRPPRLMCSVVSKLVHQRSASRSDCCTTELNSHYRLEHVHLDTRSDRRADSSRLLTTAVTPETDSYLYVTPKLWPSEHATSTSLSFPRIPVLYD